MAYANLKLLIDTEAKRVLFAEAGEGFVDFLYNLLRLSAGTFIKLLNKRKLLSNISKYQSLKIEDQGLEYFEVEPQITLIDVYNTADCFYRVMDDLTVKPMSTLSSVALFHEFKGQVVGPLEERVVRLDLDQGLELLKASLQSDMVLTSVYLRGMGANDASCSIPDDPDVMACKTRPIPEDSASKNKAMSETPPNEAIASSKPKSDEFQKRVEEWFNIIICRQDDIIREQKRIRRRVDYCVLKLAEEYGSPYLSEGEE